MVLIHAVMLAAGYGTRLERDVIAGGPAFSHLLGVPKPLLPVGGRPLLSHWVAALRGLRPPQMVKRVTVVVNDTHRALYDQWLSSTPTGSLQVRILADGSTCNDNRSGAVACMMLATSQLEEPCHTLVIAGDTLLPASFQLSDFVSEFFRRQQGLGSVLIVSAPVAEEAVSKHGILEVNSEGRVLRFLEKPKPEDTASRMQCPCVYLIHAPALYLLQVFLSARSHLPLAQWDAPGLFLAYLVDAINGNNNRDSSISTNSGTTNSTISNNITGGSTEVTGKSGSNSTSSSSESSNIISNITGGSTTDNSSISSISITSATNTSSNSSRQAVYHYHVQHRYDIGNLPSYLHCCQNYPESDITKQ